MGRNTASGSAFSRLSRDNCGASAIEFAFVAPVLLLLVAGIIEFGSMLLRDRHVFQAASSVGLTAAELSIKNLQRVAGQAYRGDTYATTEADEETSALLANGISLALGVDASRIKATATRVVRVSSSRLNKAWQWKMPNSPEPTINDSKLLAMLKDGESLMVAQVILERETYFKIFGARKVLDATYSTPVRPY